MNKLKFYINNKKRIILITNRLLTVFFAVLLLLSNQAAHAAFLGNDIDVNGYTLVSSERISSNNYLLTYSVEVRNVSGDSYTNVVGSLDGSGPSQITSYVDSEIDIGDIDSGQNRTDNIRFYARRSSVNTAPFGWVFTGDGVFDTDGDGIGDANDSDIDGDGIGNNWDDFPQNESEWADTDNDGTGDNADNDLDGDGTPNNNDPFPYDGSLSGQYASNRHSAWIVNNNGTTSNIVDAGVEVNVQQVNSNAMDNYGQPAVRVISNGIPNYRLLMTEEFIEFLNTANPRGRANGEAVWRNNTGTSATAGQVIQFGEDINYNSRTATAAAPGCAVNAGFGYWPPGPGCPDSFDASTNTDNIHNAKFAEAPVVNDVNACYLGAGKVGFLIDGSAIYGYTDALSYDTDSEAIRATPDGGDNIWHTNAPFWELYDVDICAGHAAAQGKEYHHHGWSQCLADSSGDTGAAHSPIVGYMADGYAIHGPWHDEGVLAKSAWVARDYNQAWNPANGQYGCNSSNGERNCLINDPYNPDNSGVTQSRNTAPGESDTVASISSNIFLATSGAFLEDFYVDPSLVSTGQSANPGRQLDENNGHTHGVYGYHYHMTITESNSLLGYDFAFPYTAGPQFKGRMSVNDDAANQCGSGLL